MENTTPHIWLANAKKAAATAALMLLLAGTFSGLLSIIPATGLAARAQCSDGIDNDNDKKVDYPTDDDCEDLDDDFEGYNRSGLFITLTDGNSVAAPGESLVYQITLRQERDSHRNIIIDLHLPAQVDLVSASDGGRISADGRVRWDNVTVYKDVIRTLTVNASIDHATSQATLLVSRVVAQGEEATDTTKVEAMKEIKGRFHLWVSDGEDVVQPGENLYYTLRVRNDTNVTTTTDVRAIMPEFTSFVDASNNGRQKGTDTIVWPDITFTPGESRNFTFALGVQKRSVDDFLIRTRALAGNAQAVDETSIRLGLPQSVVTSSINDGRETAARGELLTYNIEMRNNSDALGTEEWVSASLPVYSEFVDVTEGGFWDGKSVRWQNLQIAPNGVRKLSYTIRVRSDAPVDGELLATVQTEGGFDSDHTIVVGTGSGFDGFDPSESTRGEAGLLLRKIAAGDEAVPGAELKYTIYVENVLDRAIGTTTVSDRFDPTYLQFLASEIPGVYNGSNTITVAVPTLNPGQVWQTSYILNVAAGAPQGHVLTNVATISGPDVDMLPLTQRVRTVHTGVLTRMPQTGAAMDVVATVFGLVLSLGLASVQSMRHRAILAS